MAFFGFNGIGATPNQFGNNSMTGCKYVLPEAGNVTRIHFYGQSVNPANSNVVGLIWDDDGGAPSVPRNLMGTTVAGVVTFAVVQWYTFNFAVPLHLNAGTYWIGVFCDNECTKFWDAGGQWCFDLSAVYPVTHTPFVNDPGTNPPLDRKQSIYADYDPATIRRPLLNVGL